MMKRKSRLQILLVLLILIGSSISAYCAGLPKPWPSKENLGYEVVRVRKGCSLMANFESDDYANATLIVQNASGKEILHKAIVLDPGANRLRIKVAEIPAGAYFLKIQSASALNEMTFVVK